MSAERCADCGYVRELTDLLLVISRRTGRRWYVCRPTVPGTQSVPCFRSVGSVAEYEVRPAVEVRA